MEEICSSENLQRATRRYVPEESILHSHRSENFKAYKDLRCFNTPALNSFSESCTDAPSCSVVLLDMSTRDFSPFEPDRLSVGTVCFCHCIEQG
jgi:hypothetical protein